MDKIPTFGSFYKEQRPRYSGRYVQYTEIVEQNYTFYGYATFGILPAAGPTFRTIELPIDEHIKNEYIKLLKSTKIGNILYG